MERICEGSVIPDTHWEKGTYCRGIGPCPEHPRAVLVYTEVTDCEVAFGCRDGGRDG